MEELKSNDDDFHTTVVKLELPTHVMIEKWKLVLLIVGCTAFMFLIYFPIDFCLYRRRKRLARERQHQSACRASPVRAAQCHAHVTPPNVSVEVDCRDIDDIEQRRQRAQRGVIRFLNMLKMKKSTAEMLENRDGLTETVSSDKSGSPIVNIIAEHETLTSANGSARFLSDFDGSSYQKSNYSSYDDDYLDYTPEKKISNTSKNWNENQDVDSINIRKTHLGVHFDKKMSKVATDKKGKEAPSAFSRSKKKTSSSAMGPLENSTDVFGDSEYFRNPILSRIDDYVDSKINTVDTELSKDSVNINKVHQEVISNANNLSSSRNMPENESCTSYSDRNSKVMTETENIRNNTEIMFHTDFHKDRNCFVTHKKLNHSQSELSIVNKQISSKLSLRNGRKRNAIIPMNSDTFREQMDYIESSSSDKSLPISIPVFAEYTEIPKVKRKKKKLSVLKKKSADSMPDLFYETETFSYGNE